MAYYETIPLVSGDDLPELQFTLRDSNTAAAGKTLDANDPTTWAAIDLTGQTIRVYFRERGASEVLDTLICGRHAPYADGRCFMQWNPTTLDVAAGTYEGEIELENGGGQKQTVFDKLKFKVRDDF
jgi:hypothetical protein